MGRVAVQLRYKKLFTNTVIFSVSGFASKLLIFFLLPLYTAYYTPDEYGSIDLCITVVNLALPILSLQISAAVLRFIMERTQEEKQYFTIGIIVILSGLVLSVIAFPPILHALNLGEYEFLVILMYAMYALDELFSNYARAVDKVLLVGICGLAKAVSVTVLSLILLLGANAGIQGYLLAYDLSFAMTNVIYFAKLRLWEKISIRCVSSLTVKDMVVYTAPLVPNSIAWWANSYANRLIIVWVLGAGSLGFYAAANKIPSIITSIQSFISQALTLSVFEEYNSAEKDRDKFYGELFELYGVVMCLVCSVVILLTPLVARILFQGEFYEAWRYVPVLLVGTAFGAHTGYLGTFYTASKKTIGMFTTTLAGCLLNIAVSFGGVILFGIEGAGIAYLLSQILIYFLRMRDSKQLASFVVSKRVSVFGYVVLVLQVLGAWFVDSGLPFYLVQFMALVALICIYKKQIKLGKGLLSSSN